MVAQVHILKYSPNLSEELPDLVAREDPLEILLVYEDGQGWKTHPFSLLMRTPGHDAELALGLLKAEGIIQHLEQVERIWHCPQSAVPENTLKVHLKAGIRPRAEQLSRTLLSHSGCGICGKNHFETLKKHSYNYMIINRKKVLASTIYSLNESLLSNQVTFRHTGGMHAAALLDFGGKLQLIREDIGRHNALDKLVGATMGTGKQGLEDHMVFMSSRMGFELVQKAYQARIPVIASVGAPCSMAIQVAKQWGITLLGFVKPDRFNVYTHPERIA